MRSDLIPFQRSLAILAPWDGDIQRAIAHLERALSLAEEISLPGEEWQIFVALGDHYLKAGHSGPARECFARAARITGALAGALDDETLRTGFMQAQPVRFERK